MYIDHVNRRPSLREATRLETLQAKNVNIKKLKMMHPQAAKTWHNARHHGGRMFLGAGFGSWLKKAFKGVKNFASNAYNKVLKPAYQKVLKPGLDFLTKNEVGKSLVDGASKIIGSAVSAIPVVGPIAGPVVSNSLPGVLNSVDNIADAAEKVVQSIKDKNPQVTVQQAKDIVNTVKKTYNTLNDELKKTKQEQTLKSLKALPETIKAEGFEAVYKAAPFLPVLDLTTLKQDEATTKGGKLKQVYKIRKPTGADKYGKYSAPIVARVAGRMFLGKGTSSEVGTSSEPEKVKPVKTETVKADKPKTSKNMDLLQELRNKYK